MNLQDLLHSEPNTILAIKAEQMREVIDYTIAKTKLEFEAKQEPEQEQYLTRKQTAEKLKMDISSLWRWAKMGYLTPVPVGGKRMYRLSDIEKILKGA